MIVADTNLIAYFYLAGPHAAAARSTHARDGAWIAPRLWRSEFRNVLVRMVRRGDLTEHDADLVLDAAQERMNGGEYEVSSGLVMRLALGSACSAYDCEFVALAREFRIPLVTSDRQILGAFADTAITPEVFAAER